MKTANGNSITWRLTFLFASVSTSVLLLLGLIVGVLVERHFEELDMDLLTGKLEVIRHALAEVRSSEELDALPDRLGDAFIGHHGLAALIATADGRTLFSTGDVTFPEALRAGALPAGATPPIKWSGPAGSYRGFAAPAAAGVADAPPLRVALAADLSHHEDFMRSFGLALWTIVGAAALLTGVLGWFAARRGLAPLREIRSKAAQITANRLDRRLSVASIPAELEEVVMSLDAMLARLQESFSRLSGFSSDLAHELRTPVTNLLTQTQVILSKPRSPDEYRDVLASNAEELERLARTIADMLFLAKSDHGLAIPHRETVDLAAEVGELFLFYDALAEEKGLRLELSGRGTVAGDRLMLRRALGNLLANGLRHAPKGGRVSVRIEDDGAQIRVAVENDGEPIPPEHLPRLFDRFFRADPSRQQGEGAGLGLAITHSIVRAHGGDIGVDSTDGVTRFELRLPAHPDAALAASP